MSRKLFFKDKVIAITGAGSGIGAASARKLAALAAKVVLAARREHKLKVMAEELGPNALHVKTDVSKRAELDNLIKRTIARFGHVDVLWNNAGIMPIFFLMRGTLKNGIP